MKLSALSSYLRDFEGLPDEIKTSAKKQLLLLVENPGHNSLEIGKTGQKRNGKEVWYVRITQDYRCTFWWEKDEIILRRIGKHDITLRKQ